MDGQETCEQKPRGVRCSCQREPAHGGGNANSLIHLENNSTASCIVGSFVLLCFRVCTWGKTNRNKHSMWKSLSVNMGKGVLNCL